MGCRRGRAVLPGTRRNVNVLFSHSTGAKAQWNGRKVRSHRKSTFTLGLCAVVRVWLGRPRRRRPARHGFPSLPSLPSRADPVGSEASRGSWLRSDAAQRVVCHVSALPQRCLRGVSRMTPPTGARGWSGPPGSDYTPWHPGADPAGTSSALCARRVRASPASLPEEQVPADQSTSSASISRSARVGMRPTRPGREGPVQPRTSGRAPFAVAALTRRRCLRGPPRGRGARQARWYRGALPRAGCQPGPAGAASSS